MFHDYFGIVEDPFSITPDPKYLYLSERHRNGFAHLLFGVNEGGGFVQLTGEVGTGKTLLCRKLLEQLPRAVDVAYIYNPRMSPLELVAAICDELKVLYPLGCTSIKEIVDFLNAYLLESHAQGRHTVVIIDEAQNLSIESLEQIRLLTNLETPKQKLMQIILVGQPELKQQLNRPELRQLAQRITARYHLTPLTRDDTRAYIRHRLKVVGLDQPVFTAAAMRRIHQLSGGIPRLINILCSRSMLSAFARQERQVDRSVVSRVSRELSGEEPVKATVHTWRWLLAGAQASLRSHERFWDIQVHQNRFDL
ncbi:MAG: AAA family ATPase [Candidatus Thiodiazotropha sp.]